MYTKRITVVSKHCSPATLTRNPRGQNVFRFHDFRLFVIIVRREISARLYYNIIAAAHKRLLRVSRTKRRERTVFQTINRT